MGFHAPRRYARWKRHVEIDPEHEIVEGLQLKHAAEFIELVRRVRNASTNPFSLKSEGFNPRAAHLRTMKRHETMRRRRLEAERLRLEQLAAKP